MSTVNYVHRNLRPPSSPSTVISVHRHLRPPSSPSTAISVHRPAETSKDLTEEPSPDDEKRRNYGGVYVGLPSDMTTVAASQSKSTGKD
ncbi:overexpressed in colon carcinoma 1 protein homolog [Oncorhynchus clarkii lewisi]|uniref:overexpressed in colon carcinoma 1 protein homolog n=1 Tax=Oncorhynchus clarkii lewisi TaxID=490388 RepID=UPI0039B93ADC